MTNLVWCWDEHAWIDISVMGDSERREVCMHCWAHRWRPFPLLSFS